MSESGKTVEELAKNHGYEKANPVIRSMYPSKSRGQMAAEFSESFLLGCRTRQAEVDGLKKQALTLSKQIVENGKREHEATELAINFQSQLSVARSNYQETVDDLRSQLTAANGKLKKAYRFILSNERRGGAAGQMMTSFVCFRCDQDCVHSDTAVPTFCRDCANFIRKEWRDERDAIALQDDKESV